MCLIAVKEKGIDFPKESYLLHAETRNSDGIGIMYWKVNSNEVCIKKNFTNAKHMIVWCKDNLSKEDALVIHFRLATHGLKDIGNRHPFPITKNTELLRKPELICQVAVAHNGVITNYGHHEKFSDTQKFILDILSDESIKNNLHSEAVIKLINVFIEGDKLAIMHNNGEIQRFGSWETESNIFYSNNGYKPWSYYNRGAGLLGFYGYEREEYYNENTNSSVGKKVDNKGKSVVFEGLCEGCNETKFVMSVDIETKIKDEFISFNLCKKCRKAVKKGEIKLIENDEEDIETEQCCESCGEFFPTKEMIEISLDGGIMICKDCNRAYIESGALPQR
jgi:predicted glutamine amidotransferase/uncharacterized protein YbaR (Trm112 family)